MFNHHPFYFASAKLAWGSEVNARYGLALSPERLVLLMPDIEGLTSSAEFTYWPTPGVAQQWVVVDGMTALLLAFDVNSPGSAMFLAQNLVQGLPLVLLDEESDRARLVVARCAPSFEESARRAAEHYVDIEPVQGREAEFFADVRRTYQAFVQTARSGQGKGLMHYRPVLGQSHFELLNTVLPPVGESASGTADEAEGAPGQLSLFEASVAPPAGDGRRQ